MKDLTRYERPCVLKCNGRGDTLTIFSLLLNLSVAQSQFMKRQAVFFAFGFVLAAILVAGCTDTSTHPQDQTRMTPGATLTLVYGSSVSSEKLVAFVEKAYEYAHVHGKDAVLNEFNNQSGRFVDGELYVFAYDSQGNTLALPLQHDLLGKNRLNTTDANGTAFIRELISTAQSGGGFVHYYYLDPADNCTVKPKLSYVMMVDQDWIIGAGIYETNETARL